MEVVFVLSLKVVHTPEFSVVVLSWQKSTLGQVKLHKLHASLIFCWGLEW